MELGYRFGFEAAHRFAHFPPGHPNEGVHGHSFEAEITIEGEPDPASGFVADFATLAEACRRVREQLDHRMLNEIEGLAAPSLENLCIWIWARLASEVPMLSRVSVRRPSAGQSCSYTGPL